MSDPLRDETISLPEIHLLRSLPSDGKAIRLAGADLRRAKRLLDIGMVDRGRLTEKHFGLSAKGRTFLAGLTAPSNERQMRKNTPA